MLASLHELVDVFAQALRDPLGLFGFFAQALFLSRFVVQWVHSEKKGRSHVPEAFWHISVVGGVMLFIYAYKKRDAVIMAGQALACFIYVRNLMLIYRRRLLRRQAAKQHADERRAVEADALESPLEP